MGPPVYFDTSALAKLILEEPESQKLRRFIDSSSIQPVSAEISDVELVRAVMREDESLLDNTLEILAQVVLLPMTASIRLRASYLKPVSVRSLDAIHVATALEIQADLDALLSYDNRLLKSASDAGLKVLSPGSDHDTD